MSQQHEHFCPKCLELYSCTADRSIDASPHGGDPDSVCFHHYGVPHVTCERAEDRSLTVVMGGY